MCISNIKLEKINFHIQKFHIGQFEMTPKDIYVEKSYIDIIKEWLQSTSIKNIQDISKFCNFHYHFVI